MAERAGLQYRHLPVTKFELFSDRFVAGMDKALAELPGPILAHCLSGQRSIVAWAAATARHEPADQVLATLKAAGIDLAPLRDELEAQHAKANDVIPASCRRRASGTMRQRKRESDQDLRTGICRWIPALRSAWRE